MTTQVATTLYSRLADEFNLRQALPGETAELVQVRKDAFAAFVAKGFPSIKEEDWRFTNLVPFLDTSYAVQATPASDAVIQEAVEKSTIDGLDAYRLVLVNGSINFDLSVLPEGQGVTIVPLKSIRETPAFRSYLAEHDYHTGGNTLVSLNTALFTDGYYMEVKAGSVVDKPILLVHVYSADDHAFFQPRHLIVVNKHAKAEIIETAVTLKGGHAVLTNSVLQVVVNENAHLRHYHIQQNSAHERWLHYNHITQRRDSRYDNYTFSLPDSDLIRNNLDVVLDGSSTETHLYGLYLVGDRQLTDNHTAIEHRYPGCQSNELYKGVLMGNGKAVFNGKVYVQPEAQQTNAYQQNNNLLLSDKAQVYAKPQLEIFADDVKCSHGCTIGQFNPESLFYLQSRGIGEDAARNLLVEAFAFDVTDKVENVAVKEYLQHLIHQKMTPASMAN